MSHPMSSNLKRRRDFLSGKSRLGGIWTEAHSHWVCLRTVSPTKLFRINYSPMCCQIQYVGAAPPEKMEVNWSENTGEWKQLFLILGSCRSKKMQKSKSSVYVQGFYCTLYFGLLVHIKRGALGPVGSLKSKKFIKQKSLAMKFRKKSFLFI